MLLQSLTSSNFMATLVNDDLPRFHDMDTITDRAMNFVRHRSRKRRDLKPATRPSLLQYFLMLLFESIFETLLATLKLFKLIQLFQDLQKCTTYWIRFRPKCP